MKIYYNVPQMKADESIQVGTVVKTLGYFNQGDGGAGIYLVKNGTGAADEGSIIQLNNGYQAYLTNETAINYKMFGAIGDGVNDDGVQIKKAHEFANQYKLPVINLDGEYYIKQTRGIIVKTNTNLNFTKIHIDDRYSMPNGQNVFRLEYSAAPYNIPSSEFPAILQRLKKKTKVIPELAKYQDCFIHIIDETTRVGKRNGYTYDYPMEDCVYIDNGGALVGEITWDFTNITRITVYPCDDSYLTFEGGSFYLTMNLGGYEQRYHPAVIHVRRSRVVIRNQYIGREREGVDNSTDPREGIYHMEFGYDLRMENVKAILPKHVSAGGNNYIGSYTAYLNRVVGVTYKNITSEGTEDFWSFTGDNVVKNFKIEACKLNRISVHFHCWNIHIKDCIIGSRGIGLSGGGSLLIENTMVNWAYNFLEIREDFGRWDGEITIKNCTLFSEGRYLNQTIIRLGSVDHDYGYQSIMGRRIVVEDFIIDYTAAQTTYTNLNLLLFPENYKAGNSRVVYPEFISFRNVHVMGGNQKGIKGLQLNNPHLVYIGKSGGLNSDNLTTNSYILLENIEFERNTTSPAYVTAAHVGINVSATAAYTDQHSMYPLIEVVNCKEFRLDVGGAITSCRIRNSEINTVRASNGGNSRSIFLFENCSFKPNTSNAGMNAVYLANCIDATFLNCKFFPIIFDGVKNFEETKRRYDGFNLTTNEIWYNHVNSRLSNEILRTLNPSKAFTDTLLLVNARPEQKVRITAVNSQSAADADPV
ncbi:MAG TPA: hypothetical protein VE710_20570 [Candidatus Bathyarchaeia archaeon]|nr:hypothetical protein [Candidatus Bathyarchaeia archaeon]